MSTNSTADSKPRRAPTPKGAATAKVVSPPESRDKILEAAEGLFAHGGYAGVGMRQLAGIVGLSKSALFHHFPSKLDLYAAVLDRVIGRIELGIDRAAIGRSDPLEELDAWLDAVIATLAEDVPAGRLLMRALVDGEPFPEIRLGDDLELADRDKLPFERRLDAVIGRCAALLERGMEEGVIRPVSVGDTLLTVIGMIVLYFASDDLGEAMIGESIFSAKAIERRRREVREFVRRGLLA